MGYKVSALDREANTITLSSASSMVNTYLIGKTSRSTLSFTAQDNGKILKVAVLVVGNFGTGNQEVADRIVNDFKEKLISSLR